MCKRCAVFLCCCIPALLGAQETVRSTVITGLKRTKPHIAQYALEKFIGRDAETLDQNEVRAAIIDTGVLEPVSVTLLPSEDGITLSVTVEEKWSIFPLPLVLINSQGSSFGLFLADTNAFGLRNQAAVGGMYSGNGRQLMALYHDTPGKTGLPGWNTAFIYTQFVKHDQDAAENTLRQYELVLLHGTLGLEYQVSDTLNCSFRTSYTDISVTQKINNAPDEGRRALGFSPGFSLRRANWDGYLFSEQAFSFSYEYQLALPGRSSHAIKARAVYALPVVPGFLFRMKGALILSPGGDVFAESNPREAYIDILPGGFSALHYGGAQAGLEKYLLSSRIGTLSALASWQAVLSSGPAGETFAHGPAGGIRFYLRRLAIPALGFTLAYNMNTRVSQFAFSLGMGF